MGLTEEVIAILELCIYIPIFPLALIVIIRHGWKKQLGWIYLVIFCLVRIVGAGFKIASVKYPDNGTDLEWSAILQSVGLSPLLMATMGLLKRITDEVSQTTASSDKSYSNTAMAGFVSQSRAANLITKRATAISRRSRIIQIAQLPTLIALILCIVGGTDRASSDISEYSTGQTYIKAGIAIFIVIYVVLFGLTVVTGADLGNAPRGEKRIYFAVVAALPLIAVRLLYSILADFTSISNFSLANPDPWVQLFMAVIEECIVVLMYTLAGLTVAA
ncbi:hypothetical protein MMC26_002446 [Xylographa opegraphella]|nr:hypothetical protein [Xylographa opegraphella]